MAVDKQLKDVLDAIVAGYGYDPIDDLDKSEPILVRMTLGNYLSAKRIKAKLYPVSVRKESIVKERETV